MTKHEIQSLSDLLRANQELTYKCERLQAKAEEWEAYAAAIQAEYRNRPPTVVYRDRPREIEPVEHLSLVEQATKEVADRVQRRAEWEAEKAERRAAKEILDADRAAAKAERAAANATLKPSTDQPIE